MKSSILTLFLVTACQVILHCQWTTATLSEPKRSMAPATFGDKLMFVGGTKSNGTPTGVVEFYNANTNAWSTYTSTSFSATNYAVTQTGNWAIFGKGANTVSGRLVVYDNSTGQWEVVTAPEVRQGFSFCSVGNKVMLAGGISLNAQIKKTVNIYDLVSKTWSIDSLSTARFDAAPITVGSKVFFVGGSTANNGFSAVVDVYDNATGTWSVLNLSEARKDVGLAIVNDKLLIVGGQNAQTTFMLSNKVDYVDVNALTISSGVLPDDVQELYSSVVGDIALFWTSGYNNAFIYNDATGLWSQVNLAPNTSVNFGPGVALGSKIYFTGEHSSFGGTKVFIFDTVNQTWSDYILPTNRFGPNIAKVSNKVVIAGGGITPSPFVSNAVDIFTDVTLVPLAIQEVVTSNPSCFGVSDGMVIANITGGTQPYSYSLGNGNTNDTGVFENLAPGDYVLSVEDALGNVVQQAITIVGPPQIASTVSATICEGEVVDVGNSVFNTTGVFQVVLLAANGCDSTVTLNLTVNPLPNILETINVLACSNELPVVLDAGDGFSTYSWSTNASTQEIGVEQAGQYTVTVSNAQGCYSDAVFNVVINEVAEISLGNDSTYCSSSLPLTLDAGSGFSSYIWNNGTTSQTYTITEIGTFNLSVTAMDFNLCQASDNINISVELCEATTDFYLLKETNAFPNPSADGEFSVSINVLKPSNYSIELIDQYGRTFDQWNKFLQPSNSTVYIPFTLNKTGMFYVKIIAQEEVRIHKMVIGQG